MDQLKGRRRPPKALLWAGILVASFGALGVISRIIERFQSSVQEGIEAILLFGSIGLACVLFVVGFEGVLEVATRSRARAASGDKKLVAANLTIDSYQQAFDIEGRVVFLPNKHQGVLISIRPDGLEFFAGLDSYSLPIWKIYFGEVESVSMRSVEVYGGQVPGMSIDTTRGVFDIGFVRTVVMRPVGISAKKAGLQFDRVRVALSKCGLGVGEEKGE